MSDRLREFPEAPISDEDQAVIDIIRMATFDPGRFVYREVIDHGDEGWPVGKEYEPLHAWQARAVNAALKQHEVL